VFAEDLSEYLSTDEHAVSALFNGASTISVFYNADAQLTLGVSSSNPVAIARAIDVPSAFDKTLVIAGIGSFVIKDSQPMDDGAFVTLQLQKQ
jgi:hypothetical protein